MGGVDDQIRDVHDLFDSTTVVVVDLVVCSKCLLFVYVYTNRSTERTYYCSVFFSPPRKKQNNSTSNVSKVRSPGKGEVKLSTGEATGPVGRPGLLTGEKVSM